ncbi:MAG: PDZ domain-containing protein [Pirellulales bacterium]|nr:PDZ domain-containing protein [Pirellulales bacterium]
MKKAVVVVMIAGLLAGVALSLSADTQPMQTNPNSDSIAKTVRGTQANTSIRPYLGLGLEMLPPALQSQLPGVFPDGQGVLIAQVMEKSPAANAGLKMYDVVLWYNNQKVQSPEQFIKLIRKNKPGEEVNLNIVREGKTKEFKITVGEHQIATETRRHRVFRRPLGERWTGPAAQEKMEVRWNNFDSLMLTRVNENQFKVEIKFRNQQGQQDSRTFEGTRQQLLKAIESEQGLPEMQRGHLLRALALAKYANYGAADVIWDFEDVEQY